MCLLKRGGAFLSFISLLSCLASAYAGPADKLLVVVVPVADIRRLPQDGSSGLGHDDLNETQVLYNEVLVCRGENAGWYQVEAAEQQEYTHNMLWQGYPGWIRKEKVAFIGERPEYDIVVTSRQAGILQAPARAAPVLMRVSLGTRLKQAGRGDGFYKVQLPGGGFGWVAEGSVAMSAGSSGEALKRQRIVREACLFLGVPYYWGGRSSVAVDCSGLVNLAYRASGVDVPRDAHEQWMVAKPITMGELKPADLIFVSKKGDPGIITHVMLSLGKRDFIEAPGTGKRVCVGTLKDYAASGKTIYFGRMLP